MKVLSSQRAVNDELPCVTARLLSAGYFLYARGTLLAAEPRGIFVNGEVRKVCESAAQK